MNKRLFILLVFLLCLSLTQALSFAESYPKIEETYAGITSWQAELHQTNYFAQTKTTLKSQGSFYYKKGNAAIHYTKPAIQSIIISDRKITVYDKASKTAIKSDFTSSIQSLNPVKIIKTYWLNSEKTVLSVVKGKTQIQLKPKSDKQIKEINFTMDDSSGFVTSLSYKDFQGNTVTLDFKDIKVNKAIPASVWKLDLPKDVKVYNR